MSYDTLINDIQNLNLSQNVLTRSIPHGSNLLSQLNKRDVGTEDMFEEIVPLYMETREVPFMAADIESYVSLVVDRINAYMEHFWPPYRNPFSHQADFTSSIIPEMLCTIFNEIIKSKNVDLEVSAQKDLTIECTFDISRGGKICNKNKKVDVAVVKSCELTFQEEVKELPIPLLAIECKTNLDKNMLSGIEQSVTDLKKTFPGCQYFVVTEYSDFDNLSNNYASSDIDEMYILRKEKRSTTRNHPDQRNDIDASLVYEVASKLLLSIDVMNNNVAELDTRMQNGKLIER